MKLFSRYNRINITASIFTFLLGSIAFYFVLQYVLLRQLDESLRAEQQEITEYIKAHQQLPEIENTRHQWITIEKTMTPVHKRKISSYTAYNERSRENESVRQLVFSVVAGGDNYKITVNKSEVETEDLLQIIIGITIGMIGLILLTNYLVNRTIVNRLWQPFYKTIHSVQQYNVHERQAVVLPNQPVEEFNLLNESLKAMTDRISRDYENLKAFTENASHEIQTPLAVIRSKTDLLLQNNTLNEEAIKRVLEIEDGILKLSRIQQSLSLLTKIENSQFSFDETVHLAAIVEQKLEEKKELMDAKHLRLTKALEPADISFHQYLAEIVINNLLNNAIRYSPENGTIEITLNKNQLLIQNTALAGALDAGKIFNRFYKTDQNTEGTGLGLAIVKEICKAAGFIISYRFENNMHQFTIQFK